MIQKDPLPGVVRLNRLSKEAAQAFKARWKKANIREIAETRNTSATVKYKQFLELLRWAHALNWPSSAGDVETVRWRWQRLRRAYRGQKEKPPSAP